LLTFFNFSYHLVPTFLLTFCYFNKHFLLTFDRKWRIFLAFRIYRPCQEELPNWATKCEFYFQTTWCENEEVDRKMESIHSFQDI
jgi:hypothetical protein